MELTVLGSNSSAPCGDRRPSAHCLRIQNDIHLIDCGEGTLYQLIKYKCKYHKIKSILISHLHGDHIFGIFGLINQLKIEGRNEKLTIYSPKGIKEILQTQWKYSQSEIYFPIDFVELDTKKSKIIFDSDAYTITTIPLLHRLPTNGFLFTEKKTPKNTKPLSYAYCSDTVYNEQIIPIIEKVHLLYHEATFLSENVKRAKETGHSTAEEAATIASKAKAKHLLIGHFSSRYTNTDDVLYEAKLLFTNTIKAEEGLHIELKKLDEQKIIIEN